MQFIPDTIKQITNAGLFNLCEPEIFKRLKNKEVFTKEQAEEMTAKGQLTHIQGDDNMGRGDFYIK